MEFKDFKGFYFKRVTEKVTDEVFEISNSSFLSDKKKKKCK